MIKDCTYDGVHLSLLNHRGSVEHYYHFMMGFILPLVQVWPDVVARAAGRQIYIRSCAVMDPLLHELQLEGVSILPPVTHKLLETNAEEFRKAGHRLEYKSALGFDKPAAYDAQVFFTTRAQVFDRLREEISSAKIAMEALFGAGGPRVLIIDRLPPNPFYNSEGSEVKGSGAERRSVENMDDMVEVANRYFF